MPKGSCSSENVHFDFRGRTSHDTSTTTSNSTINSVGSNRSNQTTAGCYIDIGSAAKSGLNDLNDRVYSNIQFGSSKTLILSKFFNTSKTGNIENYPDYENLCSGCGYGVFEAHGELCNFCQYVLNGHPLNGAAVVEDNAATFSNIYENICDKCSQLYSGDECSVCLEQNKYNKKYDKYSSSDNIKSTSSSKKKLKKRLIHSLLGSLKRVRSFNATASQDSVNLKSPHRKLQIVHNVDGFENIFSTNQTFDLNRICQLKQQQNKIKSSSSDHHIYGKLRINEDDQLLNSRRTRFEYIKQKSQSDDYLITVDSHDPLFDKTQSHSNSSYSTYLHSRCGITRRQPRQRRNSVCEWMTSLRCETHEYYSFGAPDTVLSNPKSIPGNFAELMGGASGFVFHPRHVIIDQMQNYPNNTKQLGAKIESSSFSDEISQVEFAQQMVNEFKRNLMDNPGPHSRAHQQHMKARRQGIHLKLDDYDKIYENKQQAQTNYHHHDQQVDKVDRTDVARLMVGDHNEPQHQQLQQQQQPQLQLQRNDSNDVYTLQSCAQTQAQPIALAAGLNGGRHKPEHQLNKRCCIYEKDSDFVSDILQVFDSLLLREKTHNKNSSPCSLSPPSNLSRSPSPLLENDIVELRNCENNNNNNIQVVNDISFDTTTIDDVPSASVLNSININLDQIVYDLVLSKSLNRIVIHYEIPLKLFLSGVQKFSHLKYPQLKKKFQYFQVFLCKQLQKQNALDYQVKNKVTSVCCNRARSLKTFDSISLKSDKKFSNLNEETLSKTIKMTVPSCGLSKTKAQDDEKEEEPIYQPIWKFKTVGEVQETDITKDYYDGDLPRRCDSSNSLSLVNEGEYIEDLDEWEPDDEFTFTTKLDVPSRASGSGNTEVDTISVNTIQSSSGSTITGYASSISTMTLASTTSSLTGNGSGGGGGDCVSLTHHLFRNICIFYSLNDPKLRAILYEYDRNRCSSYFAQQNLPFNSLQSLSLLSSSPLIGRGNCSHTETQSPCCSSDGNKFSKKSSSESSGSPILADSVQAWKYLLLDVNYLEDEEDMTVSESQILKAQTMQEMDVPPPRVGVLQRFKSISSSSLLDMPAEEDKKSITERVRNKLQRGVFRLHPRSPKEGKKSRNLFRRNEATSLYLEDGMKPKYPIFKAPLEFLEMNETSYPDVPRFIVDCIEYIEQKDCIQMDGLYRVSGNKVAIDELKQKLTDSYIYEPKLLITDDIHTLTSLLKLFFRELTSPLIPHNIFKSLPATKNLMEPSAIQEIKTAFQSMKNPNRETLKFLIKHLTTVAYYSNENRMPATNLAIVWGPCIFAANQIEFDIGRMNTIAKVFIENYDEIFGDNERLVS